MLGTYCKNLALGLAFLLGLVVASGCDQSEFTEFKKPVKEGGDPGKGEGEGEGKPGDDDTNPNKDWFSELGGPGANAIPEIFGSGDPEDVGSLISGGDSADGFINSDGDSSTKSPKFGLLLNDLRCAMCHVTINGDVASTDRVDSWHFDAIGAHGTTKSTVNGGWYAAKELLMQITRAAQPWGWIGVPDKPEIPTTANVPLEIKGVVETNYSGPKVPKDVNRDGRPDFPMINFSGIADAMAGGLIGKNKEGQAITVDKVHEGNLVLIGTASQPILVRGDVLIKGDLVIKGYYKGLGSVYVTGRIYIPADLRAVNSVFPYPSDPTQARARAKELVDNREGDALALATAESILIGDLASPLYDDGRAPDNARRASIGVDNVYSWIGGKPAFEALYDYGERCDGSQANKPKKSFNLIEAFLYAQKAVGGVSHVGSYAINGGVIADSFHIISHAGQRKEYDGANGTKIIKDCTDGGKISAVHKLPMDQSYVNYDYRLEIGLKLLSEFSEYFD